MIKSYIKKPIEIKAIQYTGDNFIEVKQLCNYCVEVDETPTGGPGPYIIIPTLEGDMIASKDDYIIEGIKGEHYPCKPDIFEMSYDHIVSSDITEIIEIKKNINNIILGVYNTKINNKFIILGNKEDLEKKLENKKFLIENGQQENKNINLENIIGYVENIRIIEELQDQDSVIPFPKLKLIGDVYLSVEIDNTLPTFALRGFINYDNKEPEKNLCNIITFDYINNPNWKKGEIYEN